MCTEPNAGSCSFDEILFICIFNGLAVEIVLLLLFIIFELSIE